MFEYIHSSFPERKRSPEHTIFSKIKSCLKWSLLWNSFSSSNSSKAWLALNLFSSLNSWSSLNCSTVQLSGSTWSSLYLLSSSNSSKAWSSSLNYSTGFDFPDWNFFSLWTRSRFRTRECLWTVRPAFNFPDWNFFRLLFEGVVVFELFDWPSTFRIGISICCERMSC